MLDYLSAHICANKYMYNMAVFINIIRFVLSIVVVLAVLQCSVKSEQQNLQSSDLGFAALQINKFTYIDKTKYIINLLKEHLTLVLLIRPPRFGKTLFIQALKQFFQGKKTLFEGLEIGSK